MSSRRRDWTAELTGLAVVADDLGTHEAAREARDLAARVARARLFVPIVGQRAHGKSTLLNALLGETLLPTGVAPVNSVITVVRHGPRRAAQVTLRDGRATRIKVAELPKYLTEAWNPDNTRNIALVELFHPAPLLATGMCLVDTPGLSSITEGKINDARAFVPHLDAAIIVLGADSPVAADELELIDEIARHLDQLVFVLNKVDRLSPDDLEAARHIERILERQLNRPGERVFGISATERLAGGATRDWAAFESRLRQLAAQTSVVVAHTASRTARRIALRLSRDVAEHRDALIRPAAESQQRVAALEAAVRRAIAPLERLTVRWHADQERFIREFFEAAGRAFSASAVDLDVEARRAIESLAHTCDGSGLRKAAYHAVRHIVSRRLRGWLADVEPRAELLYRRATHQFGGHVDEFLWSLVNAGDQAFERLPRSLGLEPADGVLRQAQFTDVAHLTTVGPVVWLLDHLLTRSWVKTIVMRDALRYADRLLKSNSHRVLYEWRDQLFETNQIVESALRLVLKEIAASAARALTRATNVRNRGDIAVAQRLQQLDRHRALLDELSTEDAA